MNKKGTGRNKNGKDIKCRFCKKEFYASGSRVGLKRYCSRGCAWNDNNGFEPRAKNCIICGKEFQIIKNIEVQKKTCSFECWKKNNYAIARKRGLAKSTKKCLDCGENFLQRTLARGQCSRCHYKKLSKERKGKNNPNFKTGYYLGTRRNTRQTSKHLAACTKYRKFFVKTHEYKFCEVCGVNEMGTPQFQVHHIYFASLYPQHKQLHNFKNLIFICIGCHQSFHNGKKYEEIFRKLEKERGLKQLFA